MSSTSASTSTSRGDTFVLSTFVNNNIPLSHSHERNKTQITIVVTLLLDICNKGKRVEKINAANLIFNYMSHTNCLQYMQDNPEFAKTVSSKSIEMIVTCNQDLLSHDEYLVDGCAELLRTSIAFNQKCMNNNIVAFTNDEHIKQFNKHAYGNKVHLYQRTLSTDLPSLRRSTRLANKQK
jgi:hypothetical protein